MKAFLKSALFVVLLILFFTVGVPLVLALIMVPKMVF